MIKDHEWSRFEHYANNVRSIVHNGGHSSTEVCSSALEMLSHYYPRQNFFPKLASLQFNVDGVNSDVMDIALFISPTLSDLKINLKQTQDLDRAIHSICDNGINALIHLHINIEEPSYPSNIVSRLFICHPLLRHIVFRFTTSLQLLEHMSHIESATVNVSLNHTDPKWIFSRSQERIPLSNMKTFQVDGPPQTLLFLLQNTKCYKISHLKLKIKSPAMPLTDSNEISALLGALLQFSSSSLTSLTIRTWRSLKSQQDVPSQSENYILSNTVLLPLISTFSALCNLKLDFGMPIDLTDQDILFLCTSLPRISSFRICCSPAYLPLHFVPRMTLESLGYCATHCPNLEALELLIDPTQAYSNLPTTSSSPLKFLDIGQSQTSAEANIRAWTHVAPTLLLLFPSLMDLYITSLEFSETGADNAMFWSKVAGCLLDARPNLRVACHRG